MEVARNWFGGILDTVGNIAGSTVYTVLDNYSYGALSRNNSIPQNTATQIGTSIGNAVTYFGAAAEIAGGIGIGTGGAVGTALGSVACPVTAGAGCAVAGASIGAAALGTGMVGHGGSVAAYTMSKGGGGNSGSDKIQTPKTNKDLFGNVKGTKAKMNKKTGEIFEMDQLHKNHYEVYKNKKNYEKGVRSNAVWDDGRPKGL